MIRSEARRLGARFRPRFRIRTCCRIKTDSATTERRPPGRASRMMMTMACRNRLKMSRILRMVSKERNLRIHGTCGIRHPRVADFEKLQDLVMARLGESWVQALSPLSKY